MSSVGSGSLTVEVVSLSLQNLCREFKKKKKNRCKQQKQMQFYRSISEGKLA